MSADPEIQPPKRKKRRSSFRVNAKGWIYLVLSVSVAFAAAFKGNNFLFAIFCVLLGIFAVSGVLSVLVARRMEITRLVPETAPVGEVFSVSVRIRNAKRLLPAFCLKFEDRLTHDGRLAPLQPTPVWLPLARAGRRVRGSYYLAAHERGWARLGPFTLCSEFLPGLFTWRAEIPGGDRILVTPRIGQLGRRLVSTLFARVDYADRPAVEFARGDDEFAGVREYRPGDHPRRIHWKMSARRPGQLLVREYEDPKVRDAVVLLDTFLPNPNDQRRRARLERGISFAATLVDALLAEGYSIRFRTFAPDPVHLELEARRGAIEELLTTLALLKPTRIQTIASLLESEPGSPDEVYFILKVGEEPLPDWEPLSRSLVIDASDMKDLLLTENG
jgi:uncharacterized protein (DUF58 family)